MGVKSYYNIEGSKPQREMEAGPGKDNRETNLVEICQVKVTKGLPIEGKC